MSDWRAGLALILTLAGALGLVLALPRIVGSPDTESEESAAVQDVADPPGGQARGRRSGSGGSAPGAGGREGGQAAGEGDAERGAAGANRGIRALLEAAGEQSTPPEAGDRMTEGADTGRALAGDEAGGKRLGEDSEGSARGGSGAGRSGPGADASDVADYEEEAQRDEAGRDGRGRSEAGLQVSVRDSEGGPVPGANCELIPLVLTRFDVGSRAQVARSDPNGLAVFDSVATRKLMAIRCEAPSGAIGSVRLVVPSKGPVARAEVVVHDSGRGVLTGRVRFEDGREPVLVHLRIDAMPSRTPLLLSKAQPATFRLEDVPEGLVRVHAQSLEPEASGSVEVTVVAEQEQQLPDIILRERSAVLSGVVSDQRGQPVSGASVRLTLPLGKSLEALSDGRGQFRIEGAPTEGATLRVLHPSHCPLELEGVRPGDATDLRLEGGASVEVNVEGDVSPGEKIRVLMSSPELGGAESQRAYRAKQSGPASFLLEASGARWNIVAVSSRGRYGFRSDFALRCGEPKQALRLTLAPGVPLRGRVMSADKGRPIREARLRYHWHGVALGPFPGGRYGGATSNDEGTFDLSLPPPGEGREGGALMIYAPRFRASSVPLPGPGESAPVYEYRLCPEQGRCPADFAPAMRIE